MKEILGENYQPRYEGLLHFIPFEEFSGVQMKPLGHGKYGAVLGATWHRPRSMEQKQASEILVVLKRVLPNLNLSEREKLKKFFHEVQILRVQEFMYSLTSRTVHWQEVLEDVFIFMASQSYRIMKTEILKKMMELYV